MITINKLQTQLKTTTMRLRILQITLIAAMVLFVLPTFSQDDKINFYRAYDQRGVTMFETPKTDTVKFTKMKVRIGGNFTQQFQALTHSTKAIDVIHAGSGQNLNKLYPLANGFNLAVANLRFDVQLEDGIRMSLESYMSSRHHQEFWVKGGYVQIDKLPMLGNPEWFSKYVTVKLGHFGINYGDQQFRRSDNGNTILNPFVGNYIMDAFTTEIGGEVYVRPMGDLFLMGGLTSGIINGDVKEAYDTNGDVIKKNPSILAKVGYDKQISEKLRVRLSASLYSNSGTTRNTLYGGDRTGSRYYMVVEPERFVSSGVLTLSTPTNRFTSGRFNPGLTHQLTSISINPFVKFHGLEFFGTYETTSGKESPETAENRKFNQIAGELVYRFLPNEQAFIGGRYNKVSGQLTGYTDDISINRIQISMGWYTTKNLLVKLEYVTQNHNGFKDTDIRYGAKFSGVMIEAAIGF
jgi:hypothetical protein